MHSDKYYIKQALKEANKALLIDEVPVGAIIVKDNQIIAKAHNQKESKKMATFHAEILAINKACKKLDSWHLDDCTLYVTLEPCMMCMGAIINSRIKRVVYGAKSFQDGCIQSAINILEVKGLNHYPETIYNDEIKMCSKIISDYFKTKR